MYPIADEKCLFIMIVVQGFNNNANNYFEGWEPVRDYIAENFDIIFSKGIKRKEIDVGVLGCTEKSGGMVSHYSGKSQFMLITNENYKKPTTVIPGTPLHRLQATRRFTLPVVDEMLLELRTIVDRMRPTDAVFRTNHASNYLPLSGRLPSDRGRIVETIDRALAGQVALRPERARGL